MVLEQKEMVKKAELAFEDFCRAMKERIGSTFAEKDKSIIKNVFVNGYMKALDDLVNMAKQNLN